MNKTPAVCLLILTLSLSACILVATPTRNKSETHSELTNIPVYPGSTAWMEGIPGVDHLPKKLKTYSYFAKVFKYETLVEFYEEKLPDTGWELFEKSEDRKIRSAGLMFSKEHTVADLQMMPWTASSYIVTVVFYDDPLSE
jgi:hypothetical protein